MNKSIAAVLFLPAAITMPTTAFGDLQPMALEGEFSSPNALWRLGDGRMAFRARTAETGSEMWVTDGTAGATSVVDLVPGTYGGAPAESTPFAGGYLLTATHPDTGYEPWYTDLKNDHRILADLRPGGAGSFAQYYATTSTHVFMEAEIAPGTWSWYYMDAGLAPAPISNLNPALAGQPLRNFRATNDLFFFTVGDSNQFWRTDGTAEGTFALDHRSYGPRIGQRTALNDQLFFTAGTTSVFSGRLWRADGTPGGTAEFRPDANLDSVQNLSVVGNRMIFRNGGWNSTGLWISDGTEAGTYRLERPDGSVIDAYPTRVAGNDEVFYFRDSNAIWRSDGTALNTYRIHTHTNPGSYAGGSYSGATMTENGVYFYAYEGRSGDHDTWEIWTSDGTPEGTYRLHIHYQPDLGEVHWPIAEGNRVFYIAPVGQERELFVIDLDANRSPGDFNGNARHTSADLDLLWRNIHAGSDDLTFDMNGDSAVTPADVTAWVVAQQTHAGDITLDGDVDYLDLVAVRNNYTGSITTGYQRPWALGNFDGDDDTDFDDVVTMRLHLGAGESGEWFGVTPPDRHGPLPEDGPAAMLTAEYDPRTGLIHLLGQTLRDLVALEIVGQEGNLVRSAELSSALSFIIDDQANSLVLLALNGQTIDGQLLLGDWGDSDLASLMGLSIRYALDGDTTARTAAIQVVPEPTAGMLLAGAAILTLRRRRQGG